MEAPNVEREYQYRERGVRGIAARLFSAPNQRIAFTSSGVLVPAPGNANEETLITFDDIQSIGIELVRNQMTSQIESLTCVKLITPTGMHSIYERKLRDRDFDEIIVRIVDNIDDRITAGIDPDLWFDLATKLEMAGEWHQAFRYYSIAANRLDGTQDGDYAINCVKRLKEKLDSAAAVPTADGDVT